MKINPVAKSNIYKVTVITVVFVLISWFLVIYNHSMLTSQWSLGLLEEYNIWGYFISNTVIGLIAGIFGGTLMVYVNSKMFRKKSFRFAMLTTLVGYGAIFLVISIFVPLLMMVLDPNMSDLNLMKHLFTPLTITTFFLWGIPNLYGNIE